MSKNNFFTSLHKTKDDLEALLDESIEHVETVLEKGTEESRLEVNLIETEDSFLVEAPLPGVPFENIRLALDGDTLTIEADYPTKKSEGKTIYKEFTKGRMSRSIVLPRTFESGSENAELVNGLLTVHLNKKNKDAPHNIKIDEHEESR